MTTDAPDLALPEEREHDLVLDAHATIRHCLRSMKGGDPDALREGIDRLSTILPVHFAYEERPGGFFARIARRSGSELADRLRAQHTDLLTALKDVASCDLTQADARDRAKRFASDLAEHEAEEGRLAMSWIRQNND